MCNTRTVKVVGSNGIESFKTVVIDSLHFESHLFCTNTGMLGMKGDQELSTNRFALSDRSWAHVVVMPPTDDGSDDVDLDLLKAPTAVRDRVNRFRVHSCLVAYVLMYIKHQPSCRPNLTYAMMLCNRWYEMLDLEYNIPQPSKRKKIKLRMMLEQYAVESAVYEKFIIPETGISFEDTLPDPATGHIAPFAIEMLADVVHSLQRCLDHEVILTAWSHSLDHSPATSAHVQQVMSTLAGLHGHSFDRMNFGVDAAATLAGSPASRAQAQARATAAQGLSPEEVVDDAAELQQMQMQHAQQQQQADAPQFAGNDEGAPTSMEGRPTLPTINVKSMMGQIGMTRRQSEHLASEMAVQRSCRSELSHRCLNTQLGSGPDAHAQITKLLTDGRDSARRPMHRMHSTGEIICAKRAAGACMPTVGDMLGRGFTENFLSRIASGMEAGVGDCNKNERTIGTDCAGWEYKHRTGFDKGSVGPAGFDFSWARMTDFVFRPTSTGESTAPKRSVWNNVARVLQDAAKSSTPRCFSLMDAESMSIECIRDALYLAASNDNRRRIPRASPQAQLKEAGRMRSKNQIFSENCAPTTLHPIAMFATSSVGGRLELSPDFLAPVPIERPLGSTLAACGYQQRLDHLARNYALPVCIPPDRFTLGSPIAECHEMNGIYFNKHVAAEQANLVVEMAHFLSTVPGIAGGSYAGVPDTFKSKNALNPLKKNRGEGCVLVETHVDAAAVAVAAAAAAAAAEDAANDASGAAALEAHEAATGPSPALHVETHAAADLEAVERCVSNPTQDGSTPVLQPQAGATAQVAAMRADPDAPQDSLPYSWDMFATFATMRAIETLHNDCGAYVGKVREAHPDAFVGEEQATTLARLPHIVTRFPGLRERDKVLFPLSRSVPLKQSRQYEMSKHVDGARATAQLEEAVQAFADAGAGASVDADADDATRLDDQHLYVEGNLFARSTWQSFTLKALEARGMLSQKEKGRVSDQGLGLLPYVRNYRASHGAGRADEAADRPAPPVGLAPRQRVVARSFAAQELADRAKCADQQPAESTQSSVAAQRARDLKNQMHAEDAETVGAA